MSKKNMLSGRDKELHELAEEYETAKANNQPLYFDADDLADLTDWYAARGKHQEATEVVEYGLKIHPENTALMVEQAYLLMDSENKDKAKLIIDAIPESSSSEVKVLKANILLSENKTEEAEQLLDTIENKDDFCNIIDVAYMYLDMGDISKALEWLERGLDKYTEEEAYIAVTADCFHAEGLIEKAIQCYNKLIDRNPYSAPYWFGLARCYFEQQKFDKVIEACDFAIIADEEFAESYITKGNAFFQLKNEDSALECYILAEKYEAISPSSLHVLSGMVKASKGAWEEGYLHFEEAIKSGDVDSLTIPTIYINAALCLHKMGKKRKAHQYCKKASKLNPEDINSYIMEGRIYMEDGEFTKAIKKWAIAVDYEPYPDTWYDIGICNMEIGQLNYARVTFEHVKDLDPNFKGINERIAYLYILLRDKENFLKYNQLCENPFQSEELKRIEQLLDSNDKDGLAEILDKLEETI